MIDTDKKAWGSIIIEHLKAYPENTVKIDANAKEAKDQIVAAFFKEKGYEVSIEGKGRKRVIRIWHKLDSKEE